MLGSNFSSAVARRINPTLGWTCARCRGKPTTLSRAPISRQYATSKPTLASPKSRPRRCVVLLAATGGAAAVGLLAVGDDIKHGYEATARTARVASTLLICINECVEPPSVQFPSIGRVLTASSYRTTLSQRETIQDAEESNRLLKACHKRCADRTLKVLEKSGGIFIKLGQHLVRMRIHTLQGTVLSGNHVANMLPNRVR